MRDTHYKNKSFRVSDETWENLQKYRKKSSKSWNMFMALLVTIYKKHEQKQQSQ